LSSLKRTLLRLCPATLKKPAYEIVKVGRVIRYKSDMLLNPKKMKCFCPCCGYRFRSFNGWDYKEISSMFNTSRYEGIPQNVLCPICRALPRHRILALWCEKHKEQLQRSRILYFAPERSMMRWMGRNGITCTTADLYAVADLKLDIQDTWIETGSYDVIIANHVLEHVDDFRKALAEVHRILKPNGFFICSFPMDPKIELVDEETEPLSEAERIHRFGQNDHKRVFGLKADKLLIDAGFDVEVIDGTNYPDEILPIVGPADYDMNRLFCCRKRAEM
jgi:rubredoxin